MTKSRLFSLILACVYLAIADLWGDAVEGFTGVLGVALVVGLACIWFGDELGDMLGGMLGHAPISSTTPGNFVKFVGWLLLVCLPVIAIILEKCVLGNG
jgi:hypothetical protein